MGFLCVTPPKQLHVDPVSCVASRHPVDAGVLSRNEVRPLRAPTGTHGQCVVAPTRQTHTVLLKAASCSPSSARCRAFVDSHLRVASTQRSLRIPGSSDALTFVRMRR